MIMHLFLVANLHKAMRIGCQDKCQLDLPPVGSHESSTKEKDLIAITPDQIIHFYSSQFSELPKS